MRLERHEPHRIEDAGQRFYQTPDGVFPSVTTVLSATPDPKKEKTLAAWRERVGPEEVAEVEVLREEGAARGTTLHGLVEAWVEDPFSDGPQPNDNPWWNSIVPFLRKVVIQPLLTESAVWHADLEYAGTLDMVALVQPAPGILALLDWKSARKKKKRAWITDFFQQAAAYAAALRHMTGVDLTQAAIIVADEKEPADVFWLDENDLRLAFVGFQKRLRQFQRQQEQRR